eukprot:TRINITY_DN27461_c0_g1_i1.p1 TRINITY_DN27461_c0_g1~~TRINITY_DN27461_c0_g1_i1.p1  ORF type:complete len:563 (+),score=81.65 TRINITY_DN27461_c0_g1_i1:89-1777(+)
MDRLRRLGAGRRRRSPRVSPLRRPLVRRSPTPSPRAPRSPPRPTRRPGLGWLASAPSKLRAAWGRRFGGAGLTTPESRRPLLPLRRAAASPRCSRRLRPPPESPRTRLDPGQPCDWSPPRRRPVRPHDPPPNRPSPPPPQSPHHRRPPTECSSRSARAAPFGDTRSASSPTEPTEPSPPLSGPQPRASPPTSPCPSLSPKEAEPVASASAPLSCRAAPGPAQADSVQGDEPRTEVGAGDVSCSAVSDTPTEAAPQEGPDPAAATDSILVLKKSGGSESVRLGRVLGEGGFGKVYRGEHNRIAVAVKQSTEAVSDEVLDLLHWIRREPDTHLCVPLFEGVDNTCTYFVQVMQLCEGDLSSMMHAGGITAPFTLMSGVCSGAAAIHSRGYVHRDLNPRNVLMRGSIPCIADYDTAVPVGTVEESPTGTWPYVPPEVARLVNIGAPGKTVEPLPAHASRDVWSLGILAHELILGTLPEGIAPTASDMISAEDRAECQTLDSSGELTMLVAFKRLATAKWQVGALPQSIKRDVEKALSRRALEKRPAAHRLASIFLNAENRHVNPE